MNELIQKLMQFLAQENKNEESGEPAKGEGRAEVDTKTTEVDEKATNDSKSTDSKSQVETVNTDSLDLTKLASMIETLTVKVTELESGVKKEEITDAKKSEVKDIKLNKTEGLNPVDKTEGTVNTLADAIALARSGGQE